MALTSRRLSSATLPGGMVPVAGGLVVLGITSYGFLVLAARSLGPERYAPLSVLWALAVLVGPAVFVPLEQELSRAIAARQVTGGGWESMVRKAFLPGLAIVAILAMVAVAARGWLLSRVFDDQPLLLVGLVLSVLGYFCEHLVRGALAGAGRFGPYGRVLATEGCLRLVGCMALAVAGVSSPGPYGLVLGATPMLAAFVGARGQALFSPRRTATAAGAGDTRARKPADADAAGPTLRKALGWLLAGSLFSQLLVNGAPVAVKLLASAAEKATVGRFVAALIVARIPLFLFASVQAAALPRLSGLAAAHRHEEFRAGVRRLLLLVGAFGLASTMGAAVAGPQAVQVLFGSEFRLGRADLVYLAAASAFYMLAMTVGQALIALCAQARAAVAWSAGFVTFVVVVVVSPGLLLRAERGLLAGSMVAFAVMVARLTPLIRDGIATGRPVNEAPECLPPTVP